MGCMCLLSYAALIVVVYHVIRILYDLFFPYFIAPMLGLSKKLQAYAHPGEWAVVTGSTDGIGKGYAKELARRGQKLVLISRSQEKLEAVASEIKETIPGTEIKTVQFDFNTSDSSSYSKIEQALEGLKISVLVNNVGVGLTFPETLENIEDGNKFAEKTLNVNCLSAVIMTRIVLPKLLELKRGALINISSASARFIGTPYLGIYAASKKFLAFLTDACRSEHPDSGVFFQTVYPFFVATNMSGIKKASFFAPNADTYAKSAVKTIGLQINTVGCFAHAIQEAGIKVAMMLGLSSVFENHMKKVLIAAKQRYLKKNRKNE